MKPLLQLAALLLVSAPLVHAAEQVSGTFQSVDREQGRAVLELEDGETVAVRLGAGDAAIYEAGDQIEAELAKIGSITRLQAVWPATPNAQGQITLMADQLQRDTLQRGRKAFRNTGEKMPRFALWDNNGNLFLGESLKGQYAVINFIFSRCPDPNMCPAATERMKALDTLLDDAGLDDVKLVSITLDADYDTPGIWTAYAENKGVDLSRHIFLSGPSSVTRNLTKQLGVLAEEDEQNIIKHTMTTTLVDPTGTIIYRLPGTMWSPEVFVKKIQQDRK
ncbi:MAG: SCO family protein [Verrucomicrobiota bacterium JB022]|nr:SCO family protein [Verrucomicrobiota bacterium JB022]